MAQAEPDAHPMRSWGLLPEGALARPVIVSPHLDDAVLSCGQLMARWPGAVVITVFAGRPAAYPQPQRPWDAQCGFAPDDDVMAARRAEDHAALAVLEASAVHLDYVEYSYNPGDVPVAPAVIAEGLRSAIEAAAPTVVLAPFGLANPDHDVTHAAAMLVRAAMTGGEGTGGPDGAAATVPWCLYEDSGYKHIPGMLAWRVSRLFRSGVWPTPICPPVEVATTRKLAAMQCYPSQLRALDEDWQVLAKLAAPAPEQYWSLAPPPDGWGALSTGD